MDRREFPTLPEDLRECEDARRLLELNEIVLKACAKDPTQRYQKRGGDGGGVGVAAPREIRALAAGAGPGGSSRSQGGADRGGRGAGGPASAEDTDRPAVRRGRGTEKASVFVLPFRNEEPNGVEDDLRGRITDAIIDSLAVIEGVRRSPRKSGWVNLNEDDLRHALAKTNDLRHILTGRLAQVEDTVSLTLQLYPRGSDQPVWTESFAGGTNAIVEIERRAVGRLAAKLGLKISETEQKQIDRLLTNNLVALQLVRKAWEDYLGQTGTHSSHTDIQNLAQRALDLDPNYIGANFCIGHLTRNLASDESPREVWESVGPRMQTILEQDDTVIGALDHYSGYMLNRYRDWDAARKLHHRLLDVAPEPPQPFSRSLYRALYLRMYGQREEGRREQANLGDSEPTSIDEWFALVAAKWIDRDYAGGVRLARRALELFPEHVDAYSWLAHCLIAKGEYTSGVQAIQNAQRVRERVEMKALLGFAYARMGQADQAREVLRELEKTKRSRYVQPYFVARVYAALGEKDLALKYLEEAEQVWSEYLISPTFGGLRTDPAWDEFRCQDDPRYWAHLRKSGAGERPVAPPVRPLK